MTWSLIFGPAEGYPKCDYCNSEDTNICIYAECTQLYFLLLGIIVLMLDICFIEESDQDNVPFSADAWGELRIDNVNVERAWLDTSGKNIWSLFLD